MAVYCSRITSNSQHCTAGRLWNVFHLINLPSKLKLYLNVSNNRLFRNEGRYPERPGFETLKHYRANRPEKFTSDGILIDHGDEGWWRIRSKARHTFLNKKKEENYMPVLGNIAEEFIDRYFVYMWHKKLIFKLYCTKCVVYNAEFYKSGWKIMKWDLILLTKCTN